MAEQEPRQVIIAWMEELLDRSPRLEIPGMAEEARRHFGRDDDFMRRLREDMEWTYFYELARTVCKETRAPQIRDVSTAIDIQPKPVTPEDILGRIKATSPYWERFRENVGKEQVRLLDMTREELIEAAEKRERRAHSELVLARLWRVLADGLAPGQRVKDKFTPDAIETLRQQLKGVA